MIYSNIWWSFLYRRECDISSYRSRKQIISFCNLSLPVPITPQQSPPASAQEKHIQLYQPFKATLKCGYKTPEEETCA